MPITASDYLGSLDATWRQASAAAAPEGFDLCVDGFTVRLLMAGDGWRTHASAALAHLAVPADPDRHADVTLRAWDSATTPIGLPQPPFEKADYRRYGQRAIADDGRAVVMDAPIDGTLFAFDRQDCVGYAWALDTAGLSIYERAAPLQPLLHWSLAVAGWSIVHAAGVGTPAGGVLLVGHTGTGKSTTALSTLGAAGLGFLSDDKCLVRLSPEPTAFALFNSAKLKADVLHRFPQLATQLAGWDDVAKGGKGLVFLHPAYASHMTGAFPIRALLLPSVSGRAVPTITPTSPAETFRHLGPSTVIWLPGSEAANYRFTAELVRRVPSYHFALADDPALNTEAIRAFLAQG